MNEQTEAERQIKSAQGPEAPKPAPMGLVAVLSSMRFALGLVCAITVACIVATVLPQGSEVAEQLQNNPEAGRWLKRFAAAGLTNVFSSWWFIGLLATLGASLAACIGRRSKILFKSQGMARNERTRLVGTLLAHVGLLLTLIGGAIRIFFAEQGTIQFREGEQAAFYVTEDNQRAPLPFALRLVRFEVERYTASKDGNSGVQSEALSILCPGEVEIQDWPVALDVEREVMAKSPLTGSNETFRVTVLRRISDFTQDEGTHEIRSRSDEMVNPAILVRVTGAGVTSERWLFARYPDFDMSAHPGQEVPPVPFSMSYSVMVNPGAKAQIKSFKSTLQVLKQGGVVREQIVEVNAPLSYDGYVFYQSGYNENDLAWTSLRVVSDPSVPVVYLGFILLSIGAFITAVCRAEKVREESKC